MKGVTRAWKAAEQILEDHSVRHAPIDVERIVRRYASLVKRPLADELSGALIPLPGEEWAILVNSDHHPNRQRFTLAHELGHLVLHGYQTPHADKRFRLRDARSSDGSVIEEIQANQFAAELLMPRTLVMDALERSGLEHAWGEGEEEDDEFDEVVTTLAAEFAVSRQAMTVRLSSLFA